MYELIVSTVISKNNVENERTRRGLGRAKYWRLLLADDLSSPHRELASPSKYPDRVAGYWGRGSKTR